jgi:hypothetical protein
MTTMQTEFRIKVERYIVTKVVDAAIAAGYKLTVDEHTEEGFMERDKLLALLFDLDEARLLLFMPTAQTVNDLVHGWVIFVFGNDGWDVISDYTTGIELFLQDINKVSVEIGDGKFPGDLLVSA